jgi:hypothetical protein
LTPRTFIASFASRAFTRINVVTPMCRASILA